MKLAKRVLLSSVALLVAAAFVVTMVSVLTGDAGAISSVQPGSSGGDGYKQPTGVTSDGKVYPFKKIDAVSLEKALPKETLPAVGNMETLLKLLKERGALYDGAALRNYNGLLTGGDVVFDMQEEDFAAEPPAPGTAPAPEAAGGFGAEDGGSYSETNEQVAGVNEGDIVKTDGKYIYALSNNLLRIIRADGADMTVVSKIELDGVWGAEFYLMGDKLAVVGQEYMDIYPLSEEKVDGILPDMWYHPTRNATVLLIYDVADRANPVLTRRVSMEGYSIATRVIGDTVYLVTNKHVWAPYDDADSINILPCVRDTGGEYAPLDLDSVFYIPGTNDSSYLLVGAVNVNDGAPFEPIAYLGAGSQLYMSRGAIYLTQHGYFSYETHILRFAIDGTEIYYAGMGTVNGQPINQYSMDEYNGFFRIATTHGSLGTLVTVLDGNMDIAGKTGYLAPGEWMRSMRFMGDMGYVVTFENTDPLFTVDLSDPYNPKVLGELKIPGFSQYLHPVGDGLLLGIGRDTQELFTRDIYGNETPVGFRDVGMKVSLFDVSDPYNPREIDVLPLGEGWADVSSNPRALMCDNARGLYGFTVERWSVNNSGPSALILRVENNRLSVAADLVTGEKFYPWNSRLLFIGSTLYLSHEQGILAYDYYTFEKLGMLMY